MTTVCTPSANQAATARELLPPNLFECLAHIFSPRQVEYIAHVLTADELRILGDLKDAFIIARIKRMPAHRLERYERFFPKDEQQQRQYGLVQAQWLRDEQYLLGTRLGRSPTYRELFRDFMNNHNGLRFRAYFAMKYPHCVRQQRPANS